MCSVLSMLTMDFTFWLIDPFYVIIIVWNAFLSICERSLLLIFFIDGIVILNYLNVILEILPSFRILIFLRIYFVSFDFFVIFIRSWCVLKRRVFFRNDRILVGGSLWFNRDGLKWFHIIIRLIDFDWLFTYTDLFTKLLLQRIWCSSWLL